MKKSIGFDSITAVWIFVVALWITFFAVSVILKNNFDSVNIKITTMQSQIEELQNQKPLTILTEESIPSLVDIPQLTSTSSIRTDLLLAQIVSLEADNNYESCLAIANVILNRVNDGRWGYSIEEVVSYTYRDTRGKLQYEFTVFPKRDKAEPTKICLRACEDALNLITNIDSDVLWFCMQGYENSKHFTALECVIQIDSTLFFKELQ